MSRFLICVAPFLVVATPSFAQQAKVDPAVAVAPTPAVVPAVAPAKPRKVCRTFQVTGRRIAQSECHTAEQWAEYDKANNDAANELIGNVTHAGAKANLSVSSQGALGTNSIFGFGPQ